MKNKLFTLLLIPGTFLMWACSASPELVGPNDNGTTIVTEAGDPNGGGDPMDDPMNNPQDDPQDPGSNPWNPGDIKVEIAQIPGNLAYLPGAKLKQAHNNYAQILLGKWATPEKLPLAIDRIEAKWKDVYGDAGLEVLETNDPKSFNRFLFFVMKVELDFNGPLSIFTKSLALRNGEAIELFLSLKDGIYTHEDHLAVGDLSEYFEDMHHDAKQMRKRILAVSEAYKVSFSEEMDDQPTSGSVYFALGITKKLQKAYDKANPVGDSGVFLDNKQALFVNATNLMTELSFILPGGENVSCFQFLSGTYEFPGEQFPMLFLAGPESRGSFGAFQIWNEIETQLLVKFFDPFHPDA